MPDPIPALLVGVDPSLTCTGVAAAIGTLRSELQIVPSWIALIQTDATLDLFSRVLKLHDGFIDDLNMILDEAGPKLRERLNGQRPTVVFIVEIPTGHVHRSKQSSNMGALVKYGMGVAAVLLAIRTLSYRDEWDVRSVEYDQNTWTKGKGDKLGRQLAVRSMIGGQASPRFYTTNQRYGRLPRHDLADATLLIQYHAARCLAANHRG